MGLGSKGKSMKSISVSEDAKRGLSERIFQILFYGLTACFGVAVCLRVWRGTNLFMDTFEHIHSAWLVFSGEVPYRDFFQHHNPLLWYLFAPVTGWFYRDVNILYVARIIACLGWAVNIATFYLIVKKYLFGQKIAQYSVLLLFLCFFVWKDVQTLRPDIFMIMCLLWGVERFFAYLRQKRSVDLMISYFLFALGFLFLQKIVMAAAGFAVANLWLLIKGKIRLKSAAMALVPALVLLGAFFYALFDAQALEKWFQYNVSFNADVIEYYGAYDSVFNPFWYPVFVISCCLIVGRLFEKNEVEVVWCLMLAGALYGVLSFAPYPSYTAGICLFLAPYWGKFVCQIKVSQQLKMLLLGVAVLTALWQLVPTKQERQSMLSYVQRADFLIKNTTPDEKILNGTENFTVNLFSRDVDYFWFGFCNVVEVAQLYGFGRFDWNEIVATQKPKFLLIRKNMTLNVRIYQNAAWLRERNHRMIAYDVWGKDWKKYYIPMDYSCYRENWGFIKQNYRWVEIADGVGLWVRNDVQNLKF